MPDTSPTLVELVAHSISGSQAVLKHVTIAIGAGAARYLNGYLTGSEFAWKKFIAHVVVSGFSGWFFATVVGQFAPNWSYFFAGLGGYAGTQGFDLAINLTYRYFRKFTIVRKDEVAEAAAEDDLHQ